MAGFDESGGDGERDDSRYLSRLAQEDEGRVRLLAWVRHLLRHARCNPSFQSSFLPLPARDQEVCREHLLGRSLERDREIAQCVATVLEVQKPLEEADGEGASESSSSSEPSDSEEDCCSDDELLWKQQADLDLDKAEAEKVFKEGPSPGAPSTVSPLSRRNGAASGGGDTVEVHNVTISASRGPSTDAAAAVNRDGDGDETKFILSDDELLALLESLESGGVLQERCTPSSTMPLEPVSEPSGKAAHKRYEFFPVERDEQSIDLGSLGVVQHALQGPLATRRSLDISVVSSTIKKGRPALAASEAGCADISDTDILRILESMEQPAVSSSSSSSSSPEVAGGDGGLFKRRKVLLMKDSASSVLIGLQNSKSVLVTTSPFKMPAEALLASVPLSPQRKTKLQLQRSSTEFAPLQLTARKGPSRGSPFLTPFTASKISSPGKYLYCPFLGEREDVAALQPLLSSLKKPQPLQAHKFSIDVVADRRESVLNTRCRHLSDCDDCAEFLRRLKDAECLSFELVFRRCRRIQSGIATLIAFLS